MLLCTTAHSCISNPFQVKLQFFRTQRDLSKARPSVCPNILIIVTDKVLLVCASPRRCIQGGQEMDGRQFVLIKRNGLQLGGREGDGGEVQEEAGDIEEIGGGKEKGTGD